MKVEFSDMRFDKQIVYYRQSIKEVFKEEKKKPSREGQFALRELNKKLNTLLRKRQFPNGFRGITKSICQIENIDKRFKLTPNPPEPILSELEGEDFICHHFGCGKRLTHEEQLYGDKCINHQIQVIIDPTNFIKIKNISPKE